MTLTSLALALLAAGGADVVIAWVQARRGPRLRRRSPRRCVAVVLAEGWGFAPHPRAPVAPPGLHGLPRRCSCCRPSRRCNRRAVLWSTDDFPRSRQRARQLHPAPVRRPAGRWRCGSPTAPRSPRCGELGIRTVAVRHVRGASAILGRSRERAGSRAPRPAAAWSSTGSRRSRAAMHAQRQRQRAGGEARQQQLEVGLVALGRRRRSADVDELRARRPAQRTGQDRRGGEPAAERRRAPAPAAAPGAAAPSVETPSARPPAISTTTGMQRRVAVGDAGDVEQRVLEARRAPPAGATTRPAGRC